MYELYRKIRDKKGYKDSDVSRATGIPASTFTDWKNGRSKPNTEKLFKIADTLDTLIEFLTEPETPVVTCPDCGLTYNSNLTSDIEEHNIEHSAWEKATEKFGELYCVHAINEKIKAKNRNISHDLSQSLDIRYNAQLEVLRCLFSRSVMANGFDLNHVTFDEYVAMMMNNAKYRKHYDEELCNKIIEKYGTMPGIKDGESVYYVPRATVAPTTLAAHFNGDEYTEDELDEIRQFAEFVKNKRK